IYESSQNQGNVMDGFPFNEMSLEDGLESLPVSPEYPTQDAEPDSIFQTGYDDAFSHRGSVSVGAQASFACRIEKTNKHSILLIYLEAVQARFFEKICGDSAQLPRGAVIVGQQAIGFFIGELFSFPIPRQMPAQAKSNFGHKRG